MVENEIKTEEVNRFAYYFMGSNLVLLVWRAYILVWKVRRAGG